MYTIEENDVDEGVEKIRCGTTKVKTESEIGVDWGRKVKKGKGRRD